MCSCMAYLCFISSLQALPVSQATVLFFVCPIFTAILGIWINKESVAPQEWLLILLGILGVALVLRPDGSQFHLGLGHVLALSAAVFAGLSITLIRKLASNNGTFTLYLYFCLAGTLISITPASSNLVSAWSSWQVALSLLLAVLSASAGQLLLNQGMKS